MKTHISKLSAALLGAVVLASLTTSLSAATIFFQDDFESGLGNWNPGSAYITPGNGGNVLTFGLPGSGGDAATSLMVVPNTGNAALVYISFDYKGAGGYLGITPGANNWLAGQSGYVGSLGPVLALTYDNTWRRYEVSIPGNNPALAAQLILEDFVGAVPRGTAMFDNIIVADYSGASVPVPEPSTYLAGALLALVFGVQGFRTLRSRKTA